jgi:hypothetical protein
MYLCNLPHTLANMFRFTRDVTGVAPGAGNLRERYVEALIRDQGNFLSRAHAPVISFQERKLSRTEESFARGFGAIRALTEAERVVARERLEEGIALLSRLDRRMLDLVNLLVTDFVFAKGEIGGAVTANWLLGVVGLLPLDEWPVERYAETIFHEALHNNVNLSARVHGLYRDPSSLGAPESLVPSAIREGMLRPLDGAFHSACVAIAVSYFRYLLGDDEGVISLLRQLMLCVRGLESKSHLLTPYANIVVAQMAGFLARPDFDALGDQLSDPGYAVYQASAA